MTEVYTLTPEGAALAERLEALAEALPDAETDCVAPMEPMPLDALVEYRARLLEERRALGAEIDRIEAELERRVLEAHPDFGPEDGGTREIAGDSLILKLGWTRTYTYDEAKLAEARQYLTEAEYDALIKVSVSVDGRTYNSLLRRGGAVAELLKAARELKSTRATFEVKPRQ